VDGDVVVVGESVLGPVAAARETMLTTEMQQVGCSVLRCVAVCCSVLREKVFWGLWRQQERRS